MSDKKKAAANQTKLELWQRRLMDSDKAYSDEVAKMDRREALFRGVRELKPLVPGDHAMKGKKQTSHVRNIIFENIETQVSTAIPQPKVTPRRKKDERLATLIEHLIRNELDRMPFERINDMAERTVPIHGGVGYLTEWDNTKRTHTTVGEVDVSLVHPKQFAPQPGVYTSVEDMDWFILKIPTTKHALFCKYHVDLQDEAEAEPELRGTGSEDHSDDTVTQYIGFARNDDGGIDRFSWCNDVVLEDLDNYQARRQPVCCGCGRLRPLPGQLIAKERQSGFFPSQPEGGMEQALVQQLDAQPEMSPEFLGGLNVSPAAEPEQRYDNGPCPWCGSDKFELREQRFEQVFLPITTASGLVIPGEHFGINDLGEPAMVPTLVPYYVPDVYPIVLQRSVSVYGQLLGNSDVDAIADQQNTINRLEQKVIDRLIKAGTRITLPAKANMRMDPEDGERWYLDNPAEKAMIDVLQFSGDLQYELAYIGQVYEESRQILGITDSLQGRRDPTATSGVAKQVSAAQAVGRMESKRIMKNAAYAELFELIFKHWLAYSDEPRTVSYMDANGQPAYEEFSRYDFLEVDSDGNYFWNDAFIFACDTSAPLAGSRETMWQEARMNLQTGAFGDPTSTDTLILFWTRMEELHYPGAASTKTFLENRRKQEQQMQQQMLLQQQGMVPPGGAVPNGISPVSGG